MYQVDRQERTVYVSGLQPTVRDIELFDTFNRIAHVEKVILRDSSSRHALIVFKTVEGLYTALIHCQGIKLHGQTLHIRPLRESSHAKNKLLNALCDPFKLKSESPRNRNPENRSFNRGWTRPSAGGPRRSWDNNDRYNNSGNGRNGESHFSQANNSESFSSNAGFQQMNALQQMKFNNGINFVDYSGSALQFDALANVVRQSQPTDNGFSVNSDPLQMLSTNSGEAKVRTKSSGRDRLDSSGHIKKVPPTWKMQLQHKSVNNDEQCSKSSECMQEYNVSNGNFGSESQLIGRKLTADELIGSMAACNPPRLPAHLLKNMGEPSAGRRRVPPNLSLVNVFNEQYPRTSSPMMHNVPSPRTPISPMDPAVVAYCREKSAMKKVFAGNLSPIIPPVPRNSMVGSTSNTARIGSTLVPPPAIPSRRELTDDELSEMIVSTGNLKVDVNNSGMKLLGRNFFGKEDPEPAPWSPVKRLRAESGCNGSIGFGSSPQCSPIRPKASLFSSFVDADDDVFVESEDSGNSKSVSKSAEALQDEKDARRAVASTSSLLLQPKAPLRMFDSTMNKQLSFFENDISNSRLPSNVHSATPIPGHQPNFLFPDPSICRHASVPSIANFVAEIRSHAPHD